MDEAPGYQCWIDQRMFSPYQLTRSTSPATGHPHELVDSTVFAESNLKLFVAATNVRSGKLKVFRPPRSPRQPACLGVLRCFFARSRSTAKLLDGGYMPTRRSAAD